MMHSMFVVQVKAPVESKGQPALVKAIATLPASEAIHPLSAGGYALVKLEEHG